MIKALDHVVLAVRDLDAASAHYEALLARAPAWRTQGDGVSNLFFQLDNVAVELMAQTGPGAAGERLKASINEGGEGLKSLVFAVSDIAAMHRRARRLDLAPEDVGFRESRNAGGETRSWKFFRAATERTHGARLFFLERDHPLPASPVTGPAHAFGIDHVVVQTPDPERAAALYGARLGLDMALDRSNPEWGSRLMFFRCGDMIVEIAHSLKGGVGAGPDSIWGMTWRVADAEAAHDRMAAAGFNVSEVRVGRKPGTRVFTVRDKTCGVPTLILQPSPERE